METTNEEHSAATESHQQRKKQRKEKDVVLQNDHRTCLLPRGCGRASVNMNGHPSPGSIQGSRVAAKLVDRGGDRICDTFVASGNSVFRVQVPLGKVGLDKGKEGLLVPQEIQGAVTCPLPLPKHSYEIQSLALAQTQGGGALLGSVDARGSTRIAPIGHSKDMSKVGHGWSLPPPACKGGEGGWAGLAFAPGEPSRVMVATSSAKRLELYDKASHVRSFNTWYPPSAVAALPREGAGPGDSHVFAVTEGPQVSVWDARARERGGCIERTLASPGGEPLYAMATSWDGASSLLGVGGAERSLAVIDSRKWAVRSRWVGCVKYEIMGLSFSSIQNSMVYINGLDYEVVCGRWSKEGTRGVAGRAFAFRGDSRWCGVTKAAGSSLEGEVIVGWTESNKLFMADVVPGKGDGMNLDTPVVDEE